MEERLKEKLFRQSGQRQGQQKSFSLVMTCHGDSHTKDCLSDFTVFFWPLMYHLPFDGSICWSHGWTAQRSVVQKPSDSKISCHEDGKQKTGLELPRSRL